LNPSDLSDPLPLARALLACRSVTPDDDGAQAVLASALERLGFAVTALPSGPSGRETPNLFAIVGSGSPHLCFAGHTDVVPPGETGWSAAPFAAELRDGSLFGRGACDMKGAIAAFVSACASYLDGGRRPSGSISLLVTGDEEGPATYGTRSVVEWLRRENRMPDFCLVGEPTNGGTLGETIKVGRRGSLNATITIFGVQGHVAYPERADNPAHRLVALLHALIGTSLDEGTAHFSASRLQVTSIDIGNPATNIIPASAAARLNIRFNDRHNGASLERWLRAEVVSHEADAQLDIVRSAEPFLSVNPEGEEIRVLRRVVRDVTGREPALDTGGGTSDGRFLAPYCRVAEFGLVGATMHKVDEHVPVGDLRALTTIYRRWLEGLLPAHSGAA
jgi:succinyl-diaminopimelate desuccinylase